NRREKTVDVRSRWGRGFGLGSVSWSRSQTPVLGRGSWENPFLAAGRRAETGVRRQAVPNPGLGTRGKEGTDGRNGGNEGPRPSIRYSGAGPPTWSPGCS